MNRLLSSQSTRLAKACIPRQIRPASSVVVPPDPSSQSSPEPRRKSRLMTHRLAKFAPERFDLGTDKAHSIYDAWSYGDRHGPMDDLAQDKLAQDDPEAASVLHFNTPPPFPTRIDSGGGALKARPPIAKRDEHSYVLLQKRVVHQTGKGKIATMYYGVVVGNGKGVVGFGDAKSDDAGAGIQKASANALKNCDAVELFEGRTIWTDMRIKFGSTELHLRPRPRGFGLMCNPYVHQVCKAAGIKDISAKVHGSRNPMAVIKATLMLLHSGGEPLGMGNGIGGRGRREEKKQGIKSQATMERQRGRTFMEGGSWI